MYVEVKRWLCILYENVFTFINDDFGHTPTYHHDFCIKSTPRIFKITHIHTHAYIKIGSLTFIATILEVLGSWHIRIKNGPNWVNATISNVMVYKDVGQFGPP